MAARIKAGAGPGCAWRRNPRGASPGAPIPSCGRMARRAIMYMVPHGRDGRRIAAGKPIRPRLTKGRIHNG